MWSASLSRLGTSSFSCRNEIFTPNFLLSEVATCVRKSESRPISRKVSSLLTSASSSPELSSSSCLICAMSASLGERLVSTAVAFTSVAADASFTVLTMDTGSTQCLTRSNA